MEGAVEGAQAHSAQRVRQHLRLGHRRGAGRARASEHGARQAVQALPRGVAAPEEAGGQEGAEHAGHLHEGDVRRGRPSLRAGRAREPRAPVREVRLRGPGAPLRPEQTRPARRYAQQLLGGVRQVRAVASRGWRVEDAIRGAHATAAAAASDICGMGGAAI